MESKSKGTLYIVPTPIGNLEDITFRAVRILSEVDIIACEDTRHSGQLLKHLRITPKKLESYFEYNEKEKSKILVEHMKLGKSIALISNAGTPCISDPGYRLVQDAIGAGIKIISLPGPTAFVSAITASGLPTSSFAFLGFPPQKKGRKTFLEELASYKIPVIIYESPYKIKKLLDELVALGCSERDCCIAKEISKIHEEYIRGTVKELSDYFSSKEPKGEFILILSPE